jgi:hypothetical protein
MRALAPGAHDRPVGSDLTEDSGSIVVELTGDELISGVLRGDGKGRRFEGWLELLAALEAAHRSAMARSPKVQGDSPMRSGGIRAKLTREE